MPEDNVDIGKDELSQIAGQAGSILADAFLVFARLNFLTGDFELVKRDPVIPGTGTGAKGNVTTYVNKLLDMNLVHPDYVDEFRARTNINRMRRFAFSGERIRSCIVRTNNPAGIEWLNFCFAASKDCSEENPWGALFVMQESIDGLPASAQKRFYETDALTGLLSRGKYKAHIAELQMSDCDSIVCVYVDAVGLHELNNHLGHAKGDEMLRIIAASLRENFEDGFVYRIGGDEFVVLVPNMSLVEANRQVLEVRQELNAQNIYVSVGVAYTPDPLKLSRTIEDAEQSMRSDKRNFYENDGEGRHLRVLNERLESMLQEKQDAERFLEMVVSENTSVYVVDLSTDCGRCVTAPASVRSYQHSGRKDFSDAIRFYTQKAMSKENQEAIEELLDYNFLRSQLWNGRVIERHIECLDGSRYMLIVTPYSKERAEREQSIWVFSPEDPKNTIHETRV